MIGIERRDGSSQFVPFEITLKVTEERDARVLQSLIALAWFYSKECLHGNTLCDFHENLPCEAVRNLCADLADFISMEGYTHTISLDRVLNEKFQ